MNESIRTWLRIYYPKLENNHNFINDLNDFIQKDYNKYNGTHLLPIIDFEDETITTNVTKCRKCERIENLEDKEREKASERERMHKEWLKLHAIIKTAKRLARDIKLRKINNF